MQTGHKPERPLILVVVYQKYSKDFIWPPRSSFKDFIWHLPQSHQPEVPFQGRRKGGGGLGLSRLICLLVGIGVNCLPKSGGFNLSPSWNWGNRSAKIWGGSSAPLPPRFIRLCFRRKHNQDYAAVLKCTQWLLKATILA